MSAVNARAEGIIARACAFGRETEQGYTERGESADFAARMGYANEVDSLRMMMRQVCAGADVQQLLASRQLRSLRAQVLSLTYQLANDGAMPPDDEPHDDEPDYGEGSGGDLAREAAAINRENDRRNA